MRRRFSDMLIQGAAAIIETGAAAVASYDSNTDQTVVLLVEGHAEIWRGSVPVSTRHRIGRAESVQHLKMAIRPDVVKHAVAIHPTVICV